MKIIITILFVSIALSCTEKPVTSNEANQVNKQENITVDIRSNFYELEIIATGQDLTQSDNINFDSTKVMVILSVTGYTVGKARLQIYNADKLLHEIDLSANKISTNPVKLSKIPTSVKTHLENYNGTIGVVLKGK
jgi:hypothetical protein